MKQSRYVPWLLGIAVIIACVYVLWPLTHHGFYVSDDGEWMIIRLSAFYQSLAEGQFPVRLLGRLNHGFGYPVSNFLYPGYLYIGSLLHVLHVSFVDSVKVILAGSVIGTSYFLLLFLLHWFSFESSLIGVLVFLGSPYLLYDLYKRGSVGEVMAFFPASIMMYSISASLYWLLPLATALLIVSHNTLALILGFCLAIFAVLQKDSLRLGKAMFLGVGMTTFFWFPALFERSIVQFDAVIVSDPSQYFIGARTGWLLGVPTIIALLYTIWLYRKPVKDYWFMCTIVLVGYFFALPTSYSLWNVQAFSQLVQFPYRFLSIPVLFGPWIVAYAVDHLQGWQKFLCIISCSILWVYTANSIMRSLVYVDRSIGYYETNEGTTTVHDEYLPVWVTDKSLNRAPKVYEFISGEASASVNRLSTQTIDLSITAKETSILQLNKLYYPGWGITVDGILVPINYQKADGTMQVIIPNGNHRFIATFRETVTRFFADIVTIFFGLVYIWGIRPKK